MVSFITCNNLTFGKSDQAGGERTTTGTPELISLTNFQSGFSPSYRTETAPSEGAASKDGQEGYLNADLFRLLSGF